MALVVLVPRRPRLQGRHLFRFGQGAAPSPASSRRGRVVYRHRKQERIPAYGIGLRRSPARFLC